MRPMSDSATYTLVPSVAEPHCTPPMVPPSPTRVCQMISPWRSGSTACTMADFWPATSARRPFDSVTRIGDALKSKSGPLDSGQLVLSGSARADTHAPADDICFHHSILPVFMSSAMNESLVFEGGSL